jgi:hypothetical protein
MISEFDIVEMKPASPVEAKLSEVREGLVLPEISNEKVQSVVRDIDRQGFGVIENYLSPEDLASVQNFVESAVAEAGGEYVGFIGKQGVAGSVLDKLSDPGAFETLLHRVYESGTGLQPPKQSLYQVLRCLKGESGARHALFFHYDSYVVTALVPIIIPTRGRAGHLVMMPNVRRVRSNYLFNVMDKILLDNRLTQNMLRWAYEHGWLGLKRVAMVPGNLYFFWGYRTVHANEACDPDKIRATALFHFADPHVDSKIRNLTGKAHYRAAKKT